MTRGRAAALAIAATLGALATLGVASLDQARARAAASDRAATAGAAPRIDAPPRLAAARCIAGAGGAAAAVAPTQPAILRDGRVDPAALAALSSLAFALERTIERHGAAIPQRTGLDLAGGPVTPGRTCQRLAAVAEASSPPPR